MSNPLIEFYKEFNTNNTTPVDRGEMSKDEHWELIQEVLNNSTEEEIKEFNTWALTACQARSESNESTN